MAKRSVIERERHREKLQAQYRQKWARLKEAETEAFKRGQVPWEAYRAAQKLPRNSNLTRLRNRCQLCGRPRAVLRRFKVCRLCLRLHAMRGHVTGLRKASW